MIEKMRFSGRWVFSVNIETLEVKALKRSPHGGGCEYNFKAKSVKQAWWVYFNPFKCERLIPNGVF